MHRVLRNPRALAPDAPYPRELRAILSREALAEASRVIRSWPGYRPTPLVALPRMAAEAGVARIWYKDEATRFGLGSFKALGGAYAVSRLLRREQRSPRDITVTCATDGNHGRAVAWAAQRFGCRAVVYMHERVSAGRVEAIERYGAKVVRTPGNYDESVRQAAADALRNGWMVVSDTSYEGYVEVPRDVMQGYAVMAEEALAQLPAAEWPTHVFVQGGVGGLAASVCAYLWETAAARRPAFVVVEPDKADCLYRSAEAGRPVSVPGELDTVMAGLACGEPSPLAWRVLQPGANAFMTIADAAAIACMRALADGATGDFPVVAGESGVAGLAGMLLAAQSRELGLGAESRVLVFGTEGATDPELYERLVGLPQRQPKSSAGP
ncbi:MAG TPA: diaminopropionate ammonia-lyase [Usitatibacter sp.]|nr:diaminopropionate ammonia-lyase [Usitatibacter sp.]